MKIQITKEQAKMLKRPYYYRMGGTQKLNLPNGQTFDFDDRKYYSGRHASKYNSNIRHDNLGEIIISKAEFRLLIRSIKETEKIKRMYERERKIKEKRINDAAKRGVYSIEHTESGMFVEVSEDEHRFKYFDSKRLANTFNIPIEDAELLKAKGKTYVFSKDKEGRILELYHPSLSCNELTISAVYTDEQYVSEFKDTWGEHGQYAGLLGQTESSNQFVC